MTDSLALEAELDRLFHLPPAELVPARNALADTLRKAGDRAAADRVKSIKRPTPGAWAINQVSFREPALLERASAQAEKLRELHASDGVDGRQLAAAVDAQRSSTQAVVETAVRYCDAAGLAGGPPQQRKIFTTVQAWLSGAADEAPGRMTHDVESSGFDAIGSVGLVLPFVRPPTATGAALGAPSAPVPATPPAGAKHPKAAAPALVPAPPPAAPKGPDPRVLAHATDQLAKREREARTAVERARERVTERKQAELELDRAQLQVKDAERALVHLRAAVAKREAEHSRATTAVSEAEEDRVRTEEAVAQARTELANLRGHKSGSK
jgi:hypothetical protein